MSKKDLILKKLFVNVILILIIAFIANPQKQLAKARNSAREYGLIRIKSALMVYRAPDHEGSLPKSITAQCPQTQIIGANGANLEFNLRNYFFKDFPYDPLRGTKKNTGYSICLENGKIRLIANFAELGKDVSSNE